MKCLFQTKLEKVFTICPNTQTDIISSMTVIIGFHCLNTWPKIGGGDDIFNSSMFALFLGDEV